MIFTNKHPFFGTAKQIQSAKVYLNNKPLDIISVGALARHGLIEDIGEGEKPLRGRTPRKYKLFSNNNMTFGLNVTADSDDGAGNEDPIGDSGNTGEVDGSVQA